MNGRSRHPQSQRLVERGNSVVQQLDKRLSIKNSSDWSSGINPVMLAINTSIAKSINKTPFEVVFGQYPRADDDIWKSIFNHQQQGDVNKIILEDLSDKISNVAKETDYTDSELISAQDGNNQLKINEKTISVEYQKVDNVSDDAPKNTVIDQAADIERTESAVDDINLSINPEFNDCYRRV